MAPRKPRHLRPEEQTLWQQVADSALPLHPRSQPQIAPPPELRELSDFRVPPVPSFYVGEKASTPKISTPKEPSEPPVRMDRKAFGRMSRGKLAPEGRLDLHGMTIAEAHPALMRFILSSHESGKRLVLVITGKGHRRSQEMDGPIPQQTGILKRQVPQWLSMAPLGGLVLQVSEAHLKHGGGGAYYVYLRRLR